MPPHIFWARRLRADLDAGEAEAIALALEVEASRKLIDEHRGRQFAK
jgi:predicted nucleic acid-binding protein